MQRIAILILLLFIAIPGCVAAQVKVTVSPSTVTLSSGGTQQFTVTVTGTSNKSVVWSATSGSITTGGAFTAPTVSVQTIVTVKASSVQQPHKFGTATVTINPIIVSHSVDLSWNASTTLDVSYYNVYRRLSGGTLSLLANGITSLSYTDTTVSSGQTYIYAVTAFDSDGDGESVYSNEVTAVIP